VFAAVGSDLFRGFLQGLPAGSVYALVALGFVLTYKTSGVFNMAFGAQAYVSAVAYYQLRVNQNWPVAPAFAVAVLVLAPLLGLALEWLIFRHLRSASAVSKLVVTIGLAVAIPALYGIATGFQAVAGETPVGLVANGASRFYNPLGNSYAFSLDELVAMGVAVAAMLALGALFRFTSIGLRMRAVVESARMTELNGIAADRVSAFAWALSSLFAGLAGVLIAPHNNSLDAGTFFNLVVVAIAAAAIGSLVSLPKALLGGIGLGVLIAEVNTFLPTWAQHASWLQSIQDDLTPAIPFLVLFAVLIFVPSIRRSKEARDPLADADSPPRSIGALVHDPRRTLIRGIIGFGAIAIIGSVVLLRADQSWLFLVTQASVLATIFLSITLITGLAGQISLCQGAFAAIGAFTVYQLVKNYNMSVLLAALIGAVIAAVVGAVLSLTIRKLGGIWTAIATLAFAYFFDAVVVQLPFVGGGDAALLAGSNVPRPVIGPFNFNSNKSFLVLTVVVFAVCALAVAQLRSGTFGKTLAALRGSQVGAESIGISPTRARVIAFALSAFIAAIGGGLMAMLQGTVNYGPNFAPFVALFWVVVVVVLSARTIQGAAMAAASFSLFDAIILQGAILGWILGGRSHIPSFFPLNPGWLFVLFALGAIQYARHPEGVLEYNRRRRATKALHRRLAESDARPPDLAVAPTAVASAEDDASGDSSSVRPSEAAT
jgi:branched-subunit amino acid ABC-type transport system permease component